MEAGNLAQASVDDLIAARLDRSGPEGRAADLVLASLLGDEDLDAVITGVARSESWPEQRGPAEEAPTTGLYLRAIEAEGFRGIGQKAALRLQAGPGLTVVAGRNGSGKSSFAEAAELRFRRFSDSISSSVRRSGLAKRASGSTSPASGPTSYCPTCVPSLSNIRTAAPALRLTPCAAGRGSSTPSRPSRSAVPPPTTLSVPGWPRSPRSTCRQTTTWLRQSSGCALPVSGLAAYPERRLKTPEESRTCLPWLSPIRPLILASHAQCARDVPWTGSGRSPREPRQRG